MAQKQYKLFIFDQDGLLADSERVYQAGWIHALEQTGKEFDRQEVMGWAGKSWHDIREILKDWYGSYETAEHLYALREEYILEELESGRLPAKPYAGQLLMAAKNAGLKTALATSCARVRYEKVLSHLGLLPWLDIRVGVDDITNTKPDPEVYLKVLERAGIPAEDALAFEDSQTGAQAALQAGLPVIVVPDLNEPDFTRLPGAVRADSLQAGLEILRAMQKEQNQ